MHQHRPPSHVAREDDDSDDPFHEHPNPEHLLRDHGLSTLFGGG
mgnify:CR=1 FL=1